MASDLTVLRSLGDGTFETLASVRIPPLAQIDHVRVPTGDLNHDGKPDLVIRCVEDFVVLRGLGGGKLAVESHFMPQNMQYGWWSTRLADVDGDGNLDVVLVGFRLVRVLFGDGRGNFPRMTAATIPQLHPTSVPPPFDTLLHPEEQNQPRDLAIGHFTRTDRVQIAAGMGEGDLVVYSYDNGVLKEDSRTPSEFWLLTIRSGNFHGNGLTDVYAMGTLIWGDIYPRPRVFDGSASSTTGVTLARLYARRRVISGAPAVVETTLNMQISGDCIDTQSGRWTFPRNGIFGVAHRDNSTMEAVFDAPYIYYRLNAPFSNYPISGTLTLKDGVYSGTANVVPLCGGLHTMTVTATME